MNAASHCRTLRLLVFPAIVALPSFASPTGIPCESEDFCPRRFPRTYCATSQSWYEAESVSGASGDVVGVTFWLTYAAGFDVNVNALDFAVCHDAEIVELVGGPVYAEAFLDHEPIWITILMVNGNRPAGRKPRVHRQNRSDRASSAECQSASDHDALLPTHWSPRRGRRDRLL